MKRLKDLFKDDGFTLLEVLAVMVIVGLLAAITIPQVGQWRDRGYTTAMKVDARHVATIIESSFIDNGSYPTVAQAGALVASDAPLYAGANFESYSASDTGFTFKIVSPRLPENHDTLTYVSEGSSPVSIGAD